MKSINGFVATHIRIIEMSAVMVRIFSFTLISWLGSESPFLVIWVLNTLDATVLTCTAIIQGGTLCFKM